MQSFDKTDLHVAIVMDGNGRWATRRGLARGAGHLEGLQALRRTVEAAPAAGITTLTVFAFSSDNWRRPPAEVDGLMGLLETYLGRDLPPLIAAGVRLDVIGRRDRLSLGLQTAIAAAERAAALGAGLRLRVAVDYSARDALVAAAAAMGDGPPSRSGFAAALATTSYAAPDVDLLIRTGGEQRLSDFLLWECAYAELHFTPVMWPDFDGAALEGAVRDFARRQRRFGGLGDAALRAA